MRTIKRIEIKNFQAIEELSISPENGLTLIEGANKTGKSSALKAIKWLFTGANDHSLIKIGEQEAYAKIILSDNTTISRRIKRTGKQVVKVVKNGVEVSAPQSAINGMISSIQLDPQEFLQLPHGEQMRVIVSGAKIQITKQDLVNKCGKAVERFIDKKSEHLLQADLVAGLNKIRKRVYDERTLVNGQAKEARSMLQAYSDASVDDLSSIKTTRKESEIQDEIRKTEKEIREIEEKTKVRPFQEINTEIEKLDSRIQVSQDTVKTLEEMLETHLSRNVVARAYSVSDKTHCPFTGEVCKQGYSMSESESEADIEKVEKVKADISKELSVIAQLQSKRDVLAAELEKSKEVGAIEPLEKQKQELISKLEELKEELKESIKAQGLLKQAEAIRVSSERVLELEEKSRKLSDIISAIDDIVVEISESIASAFGVSFVNNILHYGNIPYYRISKSESISLAVRVSKMVIPNNGIPLILLDDLEALSPNNIKNLANSVSGFQVIGARVDSGDLKVKKWSRL